MSEFVRPAAVQERAEVVPQQRSVAPARIQRRLAVGRADDALEREADAVAARVIAELSRPAAAARGVWAGTTRIQRGTGPLRQEAGEPTRIQRVFQATTVTKPGGASLHKSNRKKKGAGAAAKVRSGGVFGGGLKVKVGHGVALQVDPSVVSTDGNYWLASFGGTTGYMRATNTALGGGALAGAGVVPVAHVPVADESTSKTEISETSETHESGQGSASSESSSEGDVVVVARPDTAQRLADLMVKKGTLDELDETLLDVWPDLARDLQLGVDAAEKAGWKVDGDFYLDCGILKVDPENWSFEPSAHHGPYLSKSVQGRLSNFVLDFMGANGQMGFIDDQPWFQDGTGAVEIDVNFYPKRPLVAGGLGLHKDTANENLFVNLIFNNTSDTPATEWTEDTELPDDVRMATLMKLLPPALARQLMEAKQIIDRSDAPEAKTFRGGTSGAHAFVSFVDELVWHSSPSVERRPVFDAKQVLSNFDHQPTSDATYSAMVVLAQTPGNDLFKSFGRDPRNFTLKAWTQYHAALPKPAEAFRNLIWNFEWAKHKQSGSTGNVLKRPDKLVNIPAPTMAHGRDRANSDEATRKKVHAASPKEGSRSFVRTWVRVVQRPSRPTSI